MTTDSPRNAQSLEPAAGDAKSPRASVPARRGWAGSLVLVLCVLAGSGFLHYMVDNDLGVDWPSNVLRNWREFGLFALKGKLVTNPGGFEALTNPSVYPGHKPASLYPVFAVEQLCAGVVSGTLCFHVLLGATVLLSVWQLLGRRRVGLFIGCVAVLCPAYFRWMVLLDPNALCAAFGIPFIAAATWLLGRTRLSIATVAALLVLSLAYTWLNWTTALIHGMFISYLLARRDIPWRRIGVFVALAGAASLLVVAFSIGEKLSAGGGGSAPRGGFWTLLGGYTWGPGGYNSGQTVATSFLRIGYVSVVGMLPLLLVVAGAILRCRQPAGGWPWLKLFPALVAVLEVGFLRNYSGTHPWLAAQLILVGVLLTACALLHRPAGPDSGEQPEAALPRRTAMKAVQLALCFAYALAVIVTFRANAEASLSMVTLVRSHSARGEIVAIPRSADPEAANDATRLATLLDRRLVVVDDPGTAQPPAPRAVILSPVPLSGPWPLIARSATADEASGFSLNRTLRHFIRSLMRRKSAELIKIRDDYYLYRWEPRPPSP